MWFFKAPEFFFGEDALSQLEMLSAERVFVVTDANIVKLGLAARVQAVLDEARIPHELFSGVEPDPSLQTVRRGAAAMTAFQPDWVIGLGGGSAMDAAKAMWILYERPDIEPAAISPMEDLNLRQKARLICIPTTAGTGSEANYAVVLTDTEAQRKLTLGSREATPDMAIVDPAFTAELPAAITADTGIDVLSHAIEAYTCTWANDFTDGLCLQAARLVARHLPAAVSAPDEESREKMANAAAIAGMTLGNSQVALAHAMGHAAGASFKQIPHGRITAIFLPVTIEYVAGAGLQHERYADLLRMIAPDREPHDPGTELAAAVRALMSRVEMPTSLQAAGISETELAAQLPQLVEHVEMDANTLMCPRFPETAEIEKLFWAAFHGRSGAI